MAKNGRPPASVQLFRDAARDQDLPAAIWSILYAMRDTVGRGDMDAVSLKLVEQLVVLERTRIQYGKEGGGEEETEGKSATQVLMEQLRTAQKEGT